MLPYLAQHLKQHNKTTHTMSKKYLLPALMLFISCTAMAQIQPVGHLTIFSESGDKFYLILNGERQNNVAQTNLRVEDLTNDYYTAKIIFEDKTIPDIDKKMLMITNADGIKSDVTYKIKKNANNGKITLNPYSAQPVQQVYQAPSNVHVIHWGRPDVAAATPTTSTTVTQTTTTTNVGNTVNANVNVAGVSMNVNITDPTLSGTGTTTTVTETSTTNVKHTGHSHPIGCPQAYAMSSTDFASALSTIKGQSFDETKLKTAQQIAGSNCLNATQVSEICKVFGFEQTKLDFAKFAYGRCTEPNNYFKVNSVFNFSSSSDELNEYISGQR